MTPDEFRAAGHAAVEWLAEYMETIEERPVLSREAPGALRAELPEVAPESPESFDAVLADLERVILPGLTHWQAPGFFGYFPANGSPPAMLAELISAGLGVQGMLWLTSPACTELESHVMDWLVHALDLPGRFLTTGPGGGVIQDTASSASLCALLAARERCEAPLGAQRVYVSSQAHSSLLKGARIAGYGVDQVVTVDVDEGLAMRPDALADRLAADVAAGHRPAFVCATVGTTSTCALDPVAAVAAVARRHGVWVHVDAAYAGSAAVCPELRFVNAGLDQVDSYVFNPHKWLLTNFDCSAFFVADRAPLLEALSILPEYLRNAATESGAVIDYRDWQVPLGRRFRALKLWFVMRMYGLSGLRAHIRRHVSLAASLAERVDAHDALELVAPFPLGLVCFRHRGGDERTQALLDAVNDSGRAFVTHTKVHDDLVMRVAIGGRLTEDRHVDGLWELIASAA